MKTFRGDFKEPGGKLVSVVLLGGDHYGPGSGDLSWESRIEGDFFIEGTDEPDSVLADLAGILDARVLDERLLEPHRQSDRLERLAADDVHQGDDLRDSLQTRMDHWRSQGVLFLGLTAEGICQACERARQAAQGITGERSKSRLLKQPERLRMSAQPGRPEQLGQSGQPRRPKEDVSGVSIGLDPRWLKLPLTVIPPDQAWDAPHQMALDQALAESVASNRIGPCLRLWEWSENAVVIGLHQSLSGSVHTKLAQEKGFKVVRRLTGGGSMFIQPGNTITYSLYLPFDFAQGMTVAQSYRLCDSWLVEALKSLGLYLFYQGINDLASAKGKIGGAAQRRFRPVDGGPGCILHHVTMAYDMDANLMTQVLKISQEKSADKAVKSAAKRVDPLKSQTGLSRQEIMAALRDYLLKRLPQARIGSIGSAEKEKADELSRLRYEDPSWTARIP